MISRHPNNPILVSSEVKPSADGLKVIGVFNPGACVLKDEIILVMRVAEACEPEAGWVKVPVVAAENGHRKLNCETWKMDESIDTSDPRKFICEGRMYLTSLSHLRLARSRDGCNFEVAPQSFLFPETPDETYGVEDPRVTKIGDEYYITYTAVSEDGFGVSLASTRDFVHVHRHGMIFHPKNKDACLFPEKIGGRYLALHRPQADPFSKLSIWYAESPDLLHWGRHACLLRPREDNEWEEIKIGAGPQPIKTRQGWLVLYHGCGRNEAYGLFLCLLDLDDPKRVLKQGHAPILIPEKAYEMAGFFPNVVFSNGWVEMPDGRVLIYYGAADSSICVAETTVDEMLRSLDE